MARVYGHFGELLQGRIGASGPVALVTLPCPMLWVDANMTPSRGFGLYQVQKAVPRDVLRRLLHRLTLPVQGLFTLNLSMPLGGGAGASTAALLSLALAAGAAASPRGLAGGPTPPSPAALGRRAGGPPAWWPLACPARVQAQGRGRGALAATTAAAPRPFLGRPP